ncbi:hypothetical protein ACH9EU_09310 [Kocuria sp. M1R5S2]|uniref:hypothetical protein n=1 Tax=Kocuria rhizosphaerae TaxID=3376285 RepID=UPI00378B16CA
MVKFGIRRPRPLGSLRARTTGRAKRTVKRAIIPGYGRPGTGWVRDPGRAASGAAYRRTTIGVNDLLRRLLK